MSDPIGDTSQPVCPQCGTVMHCHDCEDQRPTAGDVEAGWRLRTHLGRWETVATVVHPPYQQVRIYTEESGTHQWRYWATTRVTANPPEATYPGEPEVRFLDSTRDNAMWLTATSSTTVHPGLSLESELGYARYQRDDHCWVVTHRPGDEQIVTVAPSKAKARTQLKKIGRDYARTLGVRFNPG
jgi:hypothetical protein